MKQLQSVGLAPETEQEILELRKAYEHLDSVIKDVDNALVHIDHLNFGMAKEQLKVALDYARKAKQIVAKVGKDRATHQSAAASVPGKQQ